MTNHLYYHCYYVIIGAVLFFVYYYWTYVLISFLRHMVRKSTFCARSALRRTIVFTFREVKFNTTRAAFTLSSENFSRTYDTMYCYLF